MKVLFLDDDEQRHEYARRQLIGREAVHVLTAKQAILALGQKFDVAFLDHDLGGQQYVVSGPGTGYEVAEAIAAMPADARPSIVIVHSYNAPGARAMLATLMDADVPVCWAPFGPGTFRAAFGPEAA